MSFLDKYSLYLLTVLRVVSGLLFLEHGTTKLFDFPPFLMSVPDEFKTIMMVAGAIELVAGVLITLGLFSRIAAFIASGEMAVGYFLSHFPHGFFPSNNGGDAAILFCFVFLYLAAAGPGIWALNRK